jgi:Ca2+-binding RTX toxin-like protein
MTGGTGADTFVLNATTATSPTQVSKTIGYTEITDFSVGDELDLQSPLASVSAWSASASFFTTGSNLVVQFHNTTATHTVPFLVFDGLAGHGFHSFADMQAAGYTIVAT